MSKYLLRLLKLSVMTMVLLTVVGPHVMAVVDCAVFESSSFEGLQAQHSTTPLVNCETSTHILENFSIDCMTCGTISISDQLLSSNELSWKNLKQFDPLISSNPSSFCWRPPA